MKEEKKWKRNKQWIQGGRRSREIRIEADVEEETEDSEVKEATLKRVEVETKLKRKCLEVLVEN